MNIQHRFQVKHLRAFMINEVDFILLMIPMTMDHIMYVTFHSKLVYYMSLPAFTFTFFDRSNMTIQNIWDFLKQNWIMVLVVTLAVILTIIAIIVVICCVRKKKKESLNRSEIDYNPAANATFLQNIYANNRIMKLHSLCRPILLNTHIQ